MIEIQVNYGEEENRVLTELFLALPQNKKKRIVLNIILLAAGIYELICGLHDLFSAPTWLNAFCLIIAALAFFVVFGGKIIFRRSVSKKTRKLNEFASHTPVIYTFDEKECTVSSSMGSGKYYWNSFAAYGEYEHYLWIRIKDARHILVDLNRLPAEEAAQLRQYCADHIKG